MLTLMRVLGKNNILMNSSRTEEGRTLARVTSAQAELFLTELANLHPDDSSALRFRRRFGDWIPEHSQAFAAVETQPCRDREAALADRSGTARARYVDPTDPA